MMQLLIPQDVFAEIVSSVCQTASSFETGVTLFGSSIEDSLDTKYVVLAIAGPGIRATHEPVHYSGDDDHANAICTALRCAMPAIRWLGEVHVHPRGMTWLSGGDLRTVHHILMGTDETVHPDEFIAGVMQRKGRSLDIHPYYFNSEWLRGVPMDAVVVKADCAEVQQARWNAIQEGNIHDRSHICTEPGGSRATRSETRGHHWLREWRERACRYDFASWYR